MPNYLLVEGLSGGFAQNPPETLYWSPVGCLAPDTAEPATRIIARDNYTLSNLYVRVASNTLNISMTVRSRKNGANGNQSVSIGAGATGGFTDDVNTDSLVSGDLFNTWSVIGTGTGIITFTLFSYILSTASNTTPILAATSMTYPAIEGGVTRYIAIGGDLREPSDTESRTQYKFRVSATLSNFRVWIDINEVGEASTARTRKNGANGNQSVSIPAYASGAFEDTTNTDSIAAGNNVNFQIITGNAPIDLTMWTIQVKSNSAGRQVCAASGGTTTLGKGLTRYITIEGSCQSFNATESAIQVTARTTFTAKNMYVNISNNTITATSTFRIRKNAANGNMAVSVGASQTGQFEDTTNTDSFVATDLLNWSVVTGGTGTSMTINCIGFELQQVIVVGQPYSSRVQGITGMRTWGGIKS